MVRPKVKIQAETERLILRELVMPDDVGMFKLDSDPQVHRYLGNAPVKSLSESREIIAYIREQYTEVGIGRWAVIEKSTGEFVGWSGLKFVTDMINQHSNFYDIGYRIRRKHWGKGYATESAIGVLNYGFNKLNLPVIYGMAHVDNSASNHILKKIGLNLVESFNYDGTPHNWYKIKRPV